MDKVTAYMAIRRADGTEYLDVRSVSTGRETARAYAQKTDHQIPHWAKANPVVRIAQVTIYEEGT